MRDIEKAENYLDECLKQRLNLENQREHHRAHFPDDSRSLFERSREHEERLAELNRECQQAQDVEHEARMQLDQCIATKWREIETEIRTETSRCHGHETAYSQELRMSQWELSAAHKLRENAREVLIKRNQELEKFENSRRDEHQVSTERHRFNTPADNLRREIDQAEFHLDDCAKHTNSLEEMKFKLENFYEAGGAYCNENKMVLAEIAQKLTAAKAQEQQAREALQQLRQEWHQARIAAVSREQNQAQAAMQTELLQEKQAHAKREINRQQDRQLSQRKLEYQQKQSHQVSPANRHLHDLDMNRGR